MKKLISLFVLSLIFLSACKQSTEPQPSEQNPPGLQEEISWPSLANSPWPTDRGNMQNTGLGIIKQSPALDTAWEIKTNASIYSGLAVKDTFIYFAPYAAKSLGLQCYSFSGKLLWTLDLPFDIHKYMSLTNPTIGKDGTIYTLTNTTLFAVNPDGTIRWQYSVGNDVKFYGANIALDKEGNVYFVGNANILYKVSPNGYLAGRLQNENFMVKQGKRISFSPDGKTLYIPGRKNIRLLAVNIETMSVKWMFKDNTNPRENYCPSPVVDFRGRVYQISATTNKDTNAINCLNEKGEIIWRYLVKDSFLLAPVIDSYGNTYFLSNNGKLYSFDKEGKLRFEKEIVPSWTELLVDNNNYIYIFQDHETFGVVKVDMNGNIVKTITTDFWSTIQSPALADGRLLIPKDYTRVPDEATIYVVK